MEGEWGGLCSDRVDEGALCCSGAGGGDGGGGGRAARAAVRRQPRLRAQLQQPRRWQGPLHVVRHLYVALFSFLDRMISLSHESILRVRLFY